MLCLSLGRTPSLCLFLLGALLHSVYSISRGRTPALYLSLSRTLVFCLFPSASAKPLHSVSFFWTPLCVLSPLVWPHPSILTISFCSIAPVQYEELIGQPKMTTSVSYPLMLPF
jgi:hypothetical protein